MNQEMFALYKEKKINPAAGCLPILIQIQYFCSLQGLFVSIEMRHAPFFGWIKDLSAQIQQVFFIWSYSLGSSHVLNHWNLATFNGTNNVFTTEN